MKCEKRFSPGDEYYSLLAGECRNDFCLSCWQPIHGIFWKSKVPVRVQEDKSQHERALDLLKEQLNTEMGAILALYLTRKKVIIPRQELEEAVTLYEVLETEEMLAVKKVDVTKLDVKELQDEIAKRLAPACAPS